jgi:YVTN family beta-propeller protein
MKYQLLIALIILIVIGCYLWVQESVSAKNLRYLQTNNVFGPSPFHGNSTIFHKYNHGLPTNQPLRFGVFDILIPPAMASMPNASLWLPQKNVIPNQTGLAVGTYPTGVAVNPVTMKIYVTNELSDTLSVISGTGNIVESTIRVGHFPYGVAINPFNSRIYVTNRGSNTVSVIDGSTNTKLDNITVQQSPVGIAIDPAADWIYVTNIDSNTVSVIDGITNKITANITTNKIPYGIAINPLTKRVYVSNTGSNTVSVIDEISNKVIGTINVGKNPVGIAVNPVTNTIFVTNYSSDTVSIIDGTKNKVIDTISVGKNPVGIAVNLVTSKVYATSIQSHTISVINPFKYKVIASIAVNPSLSGSYRIHDPILSMPLAAKFPLIASLVAVNDVSNMVYVTNTGSDTVSVIDGRIDGVVERVNFNINPPNSGDIQCNGQQIVQNTSLFYRNGTNLQCRADAGQGYEFSSWTNMAYGSSNPLNLVLSQYGGTLTANYKPTLTFAQYLAIVLGPVSIISIILGWLFRNRQRKHLNKYLTILDGVYEDLSQNKNDKEALLHLQLVKKEILHSFKKGRINDSYYIILDKKIDECAKQIGSS